MKKVIEHGYRHYMETTCPNCGCRFSYEYEDIIKNRNYFINHSGWKEYFDNWSNQISCPECGAIFQIFDWQITCHDNIITYSSSSEEGESND